jgi:hypothetical protein
MGQIHGLIREIRILRNQTAVPQPIDNVLSFFSLNQHRMDYARFPKQNYFIGSGTAESGGKKISTLHLKRAGARWSEQGAVHAAKARASRLSGQWETLASRHAALPLAA